MKTKNMFEILMSLIIIIGLMSCQGRLGKAAEEANAECPIAYNMVGLLSSITYEDDNVVFTFVTPDGEFKLGEYKEYPQLLKDVAKLIVPKTVGKAKDLLSNLAEEDKGVTMKFIGKPSDISSTVILTGTELKKAFGEKVEGTAIIIGTAPAANPKGALMKYLEKSYTDLPENNGDGITLTSAAIEGNYVVFISQFDDSKMTVDFLNKYLNDNKQSLIKELGDISNSQNVKLVKLCKDAGVGIQYKYVGKKTHKEAISTIEVTNLP